MNTKPAAPKTEFDALRGLTQKRKAGERCELCGTVLTGEHPHLLENSTARIVCSCEACGVLFSHRDQTRKFVRIPRAIRRLDSFRISDAEWAALLLPIEMAFFQYRTAAGRTLAYYPSPAGCTESLLSLEAWQDILRANPVLDKMLPDVEALLVNRTGGRRDYFLAPLDECYRLTGLIRLNWRGLSGGDEVWDAIEEFFTSLSERAIVEKEAAHA